ncbi:unnamed protein product [Bursaphelenchus okinawaensis]|uniref:Uncharacterized protein n=1 Tax=Bursaphelenchus okinawaensis TaxID=465554 RepID=A0A811LNG2_9BILA|nr:unnamed protein product [Bursaphelenchus okinawaensis]CAG9127272.1 unnamed protein product [Bursaphelenchus okinawaensis]
MYWTNPTKFMQWSLRKPNLVAISLNARVIEVEICHTVKMKISGRVRPTKTNPINNVSLDTAVPNWQFLNREVQFKEIMIHKSHELEEQLIDAMEKANQDITEVLIYDNQALEHHSFKEELLSYSYHWI